VSWSDVEFPPEWEAYPGHYRSHNPWFTNFRVVLRQGWLLLVSPDGSEKRLMPLPNGDFRVGQDERLPERIRFDTLIEGKSHHAYLTWGGDYYRTFTP
jgi:hypothetical protein